MNQKNVWNSWRRTRRTRRRRRSKGYLSSTASSNARKFFSISKAITMERSELFELLRNYYLCFELLKIRRLNFDSLQDPASLTPLGSEGNSSSGQSEQLATLGYENNTGTGGEQPVNLICKRPPSALDQQQRTNGITGTLMIISQ